MYLKNRNIISKIRRSKVTNYAALKYCGVPWTSNTQISDKRSLHKTGVYLFDFLCSSIQFYLLLSPYLCYISLLYLDLYVLGGDALIA